MPRGIKKNKVQKEIDTIENSISNSDLQTESPDLADKVFEEAVKPTAPKKPASKKAENEISDLKIKYPSRTLEDLRKMDFVHQYESKFPKVERPGYVVAWICNTPNKNYRDIYYRQGYDYVDGVETVASGYSDQSGEDRYAHYAMQIPKEIYDKRQKSLSDLTNKMYGHILKPNKKGKEIDGDGMYDPKGREVKTVNKVLVKDE